MTIAKQNRVKVSLIVPVYNAAGHLAVCMESIQGQTLGDFEVICVDDGSTDESLGMLREYAAKDARIKVLTQANAGAGVARNRALDEAKGEWVAFMDPDDCYPYKDVLEHLVAASNAHQVDICGGSLRTIDVAGKVVTKRYRGDSEGYVFDADGMREYRDYQFGYGYWRFIYRRSFLNQHNLRFPAFRRFQDPPFMVAAFTAAGRFYALKEETYCYREGEGFKNVNWKANDFLKARHFLMGMHRVLSTAKKEGYTELYNRMLRRMFTGGGKFLWTDEYYPHLTEQMTPIIEEFLPTVSIVIPVYNVEAFVGETLDSVLAQTYPKLEVICVNDGSTDASLEVVNRYKDKFKGAKRLIVHSQKNGGLSAARNAGMDLATGKYIYFLDSDDKIVPQAMSELVLLAETKGLDQIIFSSDVFIDGDDPELIKEANKFRKYYTLPIEECDREVSGDVLFDRLTSLKCFHCSQPLRFYRREVLEDNNCRFPVGLLHEDTYFAPVSMRFARKVMAVNRRYYQRRVRHESIMTSKSNNAKKLHGVVGVCLALLNNEGLWTGSDVYVAALQRHILSMSGRIGWLARDVDASEWRQALNGLIKTESEERLWLQFVLPALKNGVVGASRETGQRVGVSTPPHESVVKSLYSVFCVLRSDRFDADWYLRMNPDVAAHHINPAWHYVRHGAAEGRDPGPNFSTEGYLAANPDVAESGINPLVHWERHGKKEGRPLR